MVRLIPVEQRGRMVWVEDAPDHCPAGHSHPLPVWGPCPARCGYHLRLWRCQVSGCAAVAVDDEHDCPGHTREQV